MVFFLCLNNLEFVADTTDIILWQRSFILFSWASLEWTDFVLDIQVPNLTFELSMKKHKYNKRRVEWTNQKS